MKFTEGQCLEVCKIIAPKYALEPLVVLTFCRQEPKKDAKDPKLFLADVAAPEPGFYGWLQKRVEFATTSEVLFSASYGVTQVMGEVLREQGYFERDFQSQNDAYKATYGVPTHPNHIRDAIDRYCENLPAQIDACCRKIVAAKKTAGEDLRKIALTYNGGGRPGYADEWMEKYNAIQKDYGGAS